jgi:hypothetical protein
MARYNLTLRDGSTIQVEAPENASQEEILRRANRQRTLQGMQERFAGREEGRQARLAELDAMRPPPPEEETGFFGDLAGGFASGVVGVGETAALGAATLLDEEEELAARERIQGAASAIRPSFGDEEDLTFKIASAFRFHRRVYRCRCCRHLWCRRGGSWCRRRRHRRSSRRRHARCRCRRW